MSVKDLMTKNVKTCRPTDMLNAAARIMWEEDCGCVPVVGDDNQIVGMLTDRDICMAAYTRNQPPGSITVDSVMAKQLHACGPDETPAAAEQLMQLNQIRRLPVISYEGQLLGILSLCDLARAVAEKKRDPTPGMNAAAIEATLAGICRSRSASEAQPMSMVSAAVY
jgi:CBS domain-containing protein